MKLSYRFLWVFAGAVLLASCASAPKPVPQAPAPEPQASAPTPQVAAPTAELQQAKALKAQIDKYGLNSQVPDEYQKGVTALTAGENAIGTDNATAKTRLDEAIASFKAVEQAGFPKVVQGREQQVAQAKSEARAAKADVAVPDTYNQAVSYEKQAADKKSSGAYADAYDLLGKALDQYGKATEMAKQQRAAAEAALKDANDQIDQTKQQVETLQKDLQAVQSGSSDQTTTGGQ
jgi:chromosome segregation ATPase